MVGVLCCVRAGRCRTVVPAPRHAVAFVVYWVPFAVLGPNEYGGRGFNVVLKVLYGWHDLRLERIFVRNDHSLWKYYMEIPAVRPAMTKFFYGFMWALVGSRSKSSSLISLCGIGR